MSGVRIRWVSGLGALALATMATGCASVPAQTAPAAPIEIRSGSPAARSAPLPAPSAPVARQLALAAAPSESEQAPESQALPTVAEIAALPLPTPQPAAEPVQTAALPPVTTPVATPVTAPPTAPVTASASARPTAPARAIPVDPSRDIDAIAAALRDIQARERIDPLRPPAEITVLRGETLYDVSERTQTSLQDLIAANRLAAPYRLQAGQVLRLPSPNVHVVRRGETLLQIARAYSVDHRSLGAFNRIAPPFAVKPGDRIVLPQGARAAAATPRRPGDPPVARPQLPVSAPAPAASAAPALRWLWPVEGDILSGFGPKGDGRRNDGVNIAADRGAPIQAAADGEVVYAGNQIPGYGWLVLVRHTGGWVTAYAHADSLAVREGQQVRRGDQLGVVGQTGGRDRPQLHFQIRQGTRPVDPLRQMPARAGA